jgi:hypothetical protein
MACCAGGVDDQLGGKIPVSVLWAREAVAKLHVGNVSRPSGLRTIDIEAPGSLLGDVVFTYVPNWR